MKLLGWLVPWWVWLIVGALTLGGAFYGGYHLKQLQHDAQELKLMIALDSSLDEGLIKQRKIDRQAAELLQKSEQPVKIIYRTIKKEIPGATTNTPCFNQPSRELWNRALKGDAGTGKADTADSAQGAGGASAPARKGWEFNR